MERRGRWARCIALLWATLQLLSPGVSAIADGRLAAESAGAPLVHVESTGTASCPTVHPPDCGVCRFLSTGSELLPIAGLAATVARSECRVTTRIARWTSAGIALPHGRAPPAI